MRYAVLGSGSKANAYIFEGGGISFMVDNGYSLRELTRRAAEAGFVLNRLDFLFLTHTHTDHFRGVESLCRRLDVPVVAPAGMPLDRLWRTDTPPHRLDIEPGREYSRGCLTFEAFRTSHDSPESVGYVFHLDGRRFAIMTDTGCVTEGMERLAPQAELLFLEANYDPDLLSVSSYPAFVKARIASMRGHLPNQESAAFVNRFTQQGSDRLQRLYLTHLSEENNTPEAVRTAFATGLDWKGPVTVCPRNELYTPKESLNV